MYYVSFFDLLYHVYSWRMKRRMKREYIQHIVFICFSLFCLSLKSSKHFLITNGNEKLENPIEKIIIHFYVLNWVFVILTKENVHFVYSLNILYLKSFL